VEDNNELIRKEKDESRKQMSVAEKVEFLQDISLRLQQTSAKMRNLKSLKEIRVFLTGVTVDKMTRPKDLTTFINNLEKFVSKERTGKERKTYAELETVYNTPMSEEDRAVMSKAEIDKLSLLAAICTYKRIEEEKLAEAKESTPAGKMDKREALQVKEKKKKRDRGTDEFDIDALSDGDVDAQEAKKEKKRTQRSQKGEAALLLLEQKGKNDKEAFQRQHLAEEEAFRRQKEADDRRDDRQEKFFSMIVQNQQKADQDRDERFFKFLEMILDKKKN
jgi:DNA polymerase III alpha subunit (gram-positive type)